MQAIFSCVDIEVDSLVLVKIVQSKAAITWRISYEIRGILRYLGDMNFSIQHTENNCVLICFLI